MKEDSKEDRILRVVGIKVGEATFFVPLDDGCDLLSLVHEEVERSELLLRPVDSSETPKVDD